MTRRAFPFGWQRTSARQMLTLIVALAAIPSASAQTTDGGEGSLPPAESPALPEARSTVVKLGPVDVSGERPAVDIGPMPGLKLTRDQLPYNLQTATGKELRASRALGLGDFLNAQFQGVSVNDYQGNPFQIDVNFRGFTASPQIGTAQGLSVFVDGIRVNEPFGDVVNFDLLPLNAIETFNLFPGSNPLFGLNTLGGAFSLQTRSGFTSSGFEAEASGGSFGRRQAKLTGGLSQGEFAGFAALSYFEEDGWRDNSPSTVRQGFFRGDWRRDGASLTATALLADNNLIGNGLIPIELYREDRSAVFTSPDRTGNELSQFQISGLLPFSERSNITAMVYRRDSSRKSLNGDVYDGFEDFESRDSAPVPPYGFLPGLPVCQYPDPEGTGVNFDRVLVDGGADDQPDFFVNVERQPLNRPCSNFTVRGPEPRNGAHGPFDGYGPDSTFSRFPGVVEGTPVGVLSRSALGQVTWGGSLQSNWNLETHKFMVGLELHSSEAGYAATQQLGLIDANHRVYADPASIDPVYRAAQVPITINAFEGSDQTLGIYFNETWSIRPNLHLTVGGRYNLTRVETHIDARIGSDLHEIRNRYRGYVLCPSEDPASCPDATVENLLGFLDNDLSEEQAEPTDEKFTYRSFNPSIGINWLPHPGLNLFANLSRGARTPSVIELGCAYDATPVLLFPGFVDEGSGITYPPIFQPRSLAGPTCSLPSTLSGDPFLPQIRSTAAEAGVRGRLGGHWDWNLSLYRTDLSNDIYFVGVSPDRSYFQTIGDTRREGLEMGITGRVGKAELRFNYSLVDATFQDEFYVLSPHNSSADFNQNSDPFSVIRANGAGYPALPTPTIFANGGNGTYRNIRVDPGAHLPGVPLHNVNAGIVYALTPSLKTGLSMIAHSKSYVRGNENNRHTTGGTDDEIGFYFIPCQGAPCAIQQFPTAPGRPFTEKGTVPAFVVFNLDAEYEIVQDLRIFGQITNLLNTRYQTAGRLGVNPFAPSVYGAIGPSGFNYNSTDWRNSTFVGPGAPRGFFAGMSYEFGRR